MPALARPIGGFLSPEVLLGVTALLLSYLLPWLYGALTPPSHVAGPPRRRQRQLLFSGLSIYVAFALPLSVWGQADPRLRAVIQVSGLALIAGALSDLLRLPRWLQALLGLGLAWWATTQGILIDTVKPPFWPAMISLGSFATPATVLWLLAVAGAVILCRRLPGLAAGVVGITALTFFVIGHLVGPAAAGPVSAALGLALASASLGYARYDFPPPALPLGGAGHWALGFALAGLSVVGLFKDAAFLIVAIPLLLLGVPALETTYALVYAAGREGRQTFAVGRRRELLHERLIRSGLSHRRCLAIFYALTAYFSLVALLLVALIRASFIIKFLLLGVFGAAGFVLFFSVIKIATRRLSPAAEGETVEVLHIPVTRTSMGGALSRIDEFVRSRSPHMVVTSDTTAIVRAQRDPELFDILHQADLITPDGVGVVWMARILNVPLEERVSGIDLVERISGLAAQNGYTVYLLGALPGVAEEAARRLNERHPGLQVVGTQHGYYAPEEEEAVVEDVARRKPDILFVAFGIPKQEKWIRQHLEQLGVSVAIGVGGSFDVIAGRLRRAPRWMRAAGLEWLYRVIQEPRRLPRLVALPRIFWLTWKERLFGRRP